VKKKHVWLLVATGTVALATFLIYWFFYWPPIAFPSNEQLVREINRTYEEAGAKKILDTLYVDDNHVVVPYISANEDYGLSYWGWRKHKWQALTIDTTGEPMVWKVKGRNPSSFVIVWNVHPEDKLKEIQFYLIRNRNYGMTNGVEHYSPRVQMEKTISVKEKSYGVLQLLKDWALVLHSLLQEERVGQSNLFFHDFFPLQNAYFGWIPHDQSGKEVFPERTVNGNSYSTGDIYQEHVMILNQVDLER
jgi:hypothetical protein